MQEVKTDGGVARVSITLGTAKHVYDKTGVNLLNPSAKDDNGVYLTTRLLYDDLFFGGVIAALLDGQDVKTDDFDGTDMQKFDEAFWREYRAFFRARGKDWAAEAIAQDLATRTKNEREAAQALVAGETLQSSQDEQA